MVLLSVPACVYVLVALVYWFAMARASAGVLSLPRLENLPAAGPANWPRLSVVVPACNEADEIEAAARTLLAEDYPCLQLVYVDDRSTDGTGAIVDRLAAEDGRVLALHVADLPDGWLGKLNALNVGLKRADGELVLFTDADVRFAKGTLRRAVAWLLDGGLDHLTAFPGLLPASFLLHAMIASFIRQFVTAVRPWKVADAKSRAFLGIGAFNLFRPAALERAGGLEWIKLETADDCALGMMIKRSGGRSGVVCAPRDITLYWHRTLAQAARSSEKGWSTVCQFSVARTAALAAGLLAMELAPLAAPLLLLSANLWPLGLAGAAILAMHVFSSMCFSKWALKPPWVMLASILVSPVMAVSAIRVAILGRLRGGMMWRGKVYPTEIMRKGMRIRFP